MFKSFQIGMRRKVGMMLICSILLFVSSAQLVYACWAAISLEDFIKGRHVIVVGEIQRVTSAPKSHYSEDTAFIKVEKILRRWLPSPELKIGTEIPLSMPAASNEMRLSVDIFYGKGQRGVWILYYDERGKYHAGHPMSLQPLTEEVRVAAIVSDQAKHKATLAKLSPKK
jgi:hypothetical protein